MSVAAALSTLSDTLAFARTQMDAADRRFLAVAMTLAVQQACIAALLGYESAASDDVYDKQHTGEPRLAQVGELMRRVRSPDYLNDPERLSLPHSATKAVRALTEARNHALHPLPGTDGPPLKSVHVEKALDVIEHLVITHPAFNAEAHGVALTFIRDHVAGLRRASGG